MKKLITLTAFGILAIAAACGARSAATTSPGPTTVNAGSPSSVVKNIYDNAMKRNCTEIPPMLTEDFRQAVGTTKDELDALCDTFTDSGKLLTYEVGSENVTGDTATVKVWHSFKDGKKEEKFENLKKSGDKWLMDS
jgi:hypothetical protein